jgi:tRNA U55 pseudouridine synthase TruB
MLRINWFTSTQDSEGKVSVTAKMGFSKEHVADVENEFVAKLAEMVSKEK